METERYTFGYIRVSTKEQNEDRQLKELLRHGVPERHIYIDKVSGRTKSATREKYKALKNTMRRGDILYIHELDRLGRNKEDILHELRELKDEGIQVKILDLPTTMMESSSQPWVMEMINNLLIEVMATLAEAEINKQKKRQREGIDSAKARGVKFGRPSKMIDDKFNEVYARWEKKEITAVKAMELLDMKKTTFYKLVKKYRG